MLLKNSLSSCGNGRPRLGRTIVSIWIIVYPKILKTIADPLMTKSIYLFELEEAGVSLQSAKSGYTPLPFGEDIPAAWKERWGFRQSSKAAIAHCNLQLEQARKERERNRFICKECGTVGNVPVVLTQIEDDCWNCRSLNELIHTMTNIHLLIQKGMEHPKDEEHGIYKETAT